MNGTYNPTLVVLSIVIAVIASFIALDLASRVSATRGSKAAPYWLAGGAMSMGIGIWSMHFIGMLGFSLPVPLSYDLPFTLGSLLVAVLASTLALVIVSRDTMSVPRLLLAGTVLGMGIAAMHFLGMEAMQMRPRIEYDGLRFAVSVVIAIAASTVALWIAFRLRRETIVSAFWGKFLSALVMGAAIVGMHYTGMSAAHFAAGSICSVSTLGLDGNWIAGIAGGGATLFLVTTLLISVFVSMPPTIHSRLVFLVIGCMLPVSLLAVGFVLYDYHRAQSQQTENTIGLARTMTALLDKDIASVEAALYVLGTSRALTDNNYADFYRQSNAVLQELHASAITLSDATGQQLVDTRRPYGEALPIYDNPAQAQRIFDTGLPAISDFYINDLNGEPLVSIGVPVLRNGVVVYQISASILSDRLARLLARQNLPSHWISVIYDSSGTIAARSHEMARFLGKKGVLAVRQRLAVIDEGSLETVTLEGIPVTSAFSRSPTSKWTVVIGIPSASFISALLSTLRWLVIVLLLLLASSLVLAWRIGGAITRSIQALTGPALALGSGAFVSVPPLGLTEADEVGKALTNAAALLRSAQHQAHHDVLTGLANRALFSEIVRQQLMVCKRINGSLAVLYIDLDGFKVVNDTHGHEVGDALLKAVSARIQVKIRECDLAARLGGDEFAVVLIQPGRDGAAVVAGKLVDSLSIPFPIGGLTLGISASIGVALYPGVANTCEALLRNADTAMYRAKKAGKRRFVVAEN